MKIAIVYDMIYPFNIGGAEIRNYEIAKRLAKRHEVHLYGVKLWDGPDVIKKDNMVIHGICRYANLHDFKGKRTILEPIWFALNLFPQLLREKFDIIDTSNFVYFHCFSAKLASLLTGTPLVITWHQYWGDYWYEYLGRFKGSVGRLIEFLVLRISKFNVSVSQTTKNDLIVHGAKKENVFVSYNGISLKEINDVKKEKSGPDLITVARLNHQKNISLLLNSMFLLKKYFPEIKLEIIGDGPDINSLLGQAESLGLSENVSFLGFLNDKSEVYKKIKSSKLFVLSSILEGFGIVVIESQACGIPSVVIDSKWNASKELITDKELIAINNPEDLAEKIKTLILNPGLRGRLSKKYISLSRKFDWDAIVKSLEGHYEKITKINN